MYLLDTVMLTFLVFLFHRISGKKTKIVANFIFSIIAQYSSQHLLHVLHKAKEQQVMYCFILSQTQPESIL